MRLENSFEVAAPPDASWRLLNDVPRVIPCMPGAVLVEVVGDHSWKAELRVKLGPIALQFATDVVRTEMDEAAGRVVLSVDAREARGRGGAQATIESTLTSVSGGTRVDIVTDLGLRGAVAHHGRGVVADVAARLTAQFASCIAGLSGQATAVGEPGSATAAIELGPAPVGGIRLLVAALWRSLAARATNRR
jgi:carbon monoxide dehydrogenase subunit G